MANTFGVYLFITLLFLICQNSSIGQDSAATTIRIDPKNAVGGTVSQVFDRVNYIPLETTKESLFGKIDQLAVTEKYFIVRDRNTNSILVFEKDGKFHSKIQGGNDNYNRNSIEDFSIDRSKKEIVFKKGWDEFIHYDFDGKMIRKEKVSIEGNDFFIFPKDIIVYADYSVDRTHSPDSTRYELMFARKNKIYKHDLPYNGKFSSLQNDDILGVQHSPFYESGNDTSAFYWRPYDYGIYAISPSGIRRKYNFILPLANSLPAAFATNTLFTFKRLDYIKTNREVIYNISNI